MIVTPNSTVRTIQPAMEDERERRLHHRARVRSGWPQVSGLLLLVLLGYGLLIRVLGLSLYRGTVAVPGTAVSYYRGKSMYRVTSAHCSWIAVDFRVVRCCSNFRRGQPNGGFRGPRWPQRTLRM